MTDQLGFYSRSELEEVAKIKIDYSKLEPFCLKCGLDKGCLNPKVDVKGTGKMKTLIIGNNNNIQDDEMCRQFSGKEGRFFKQKLEKFGLNLDRDFWTINAINCYVAEEPTNSQIVNCKPMIDRAIHNLQPDYIWLMGKYATKSFFLNRLKDTDITNWRGYIIPDRKHNAWILPLFHPHYIQSRSRDGNLARVYEDDLKRACNFIKTSKSVKFKEKPQELITCLTNFEDICDILDQVLEDKPELFTFDYETNCLKPQRPGAKIATMSFACYDDQAFSFPISYRDYWTPSQYSQIITRIKAIHQEPAIAKTAQNLKFEDNWTETIFGYSINNWAYDTMIASHVLDCRRKITNLTFQLYKNFGIEPYDEFISKYLKSEDGAEFNTVDKAPLEELLLYGGVDALGTYWLKSAQKSQFEKTPSFNKAYDLLHNGVIEFSQIQMNGICVDEKYYYSEFLKRGDLLKDKVTRLLESEEANEYRKKYGKTLDLASNVEIKKLFNHILEYPELESVDKNALNKIKTPFVRGLLDLRKQDKIRNTYLAEFVREVCNGKLYPFIDLHIPISYRGSSSKPNFQNVPVRDEEAKKACRSGIKPSPGNQILESDYSGIEVSIAACYTKDPSLIAHVTNPNADMHRDSAGDIWMLSKDEITKDIRFYGKNGWVFPEFYGSYYENCAKNLWETVIDDLRLKTTSGMSIRQHMRENSIRNIDDFIEHCKDVEDIFWNQRFKVYKKWKDDIQITFQKQGYIESYFGFRYTGYMTYNQVTNYPIQGSAFHCLLWSLIRLNQIARKEGWRSKIIGQIHDSVLVDLYPPERDHIIQTIERVGMKELREEHPWIVVPLKIEHELTPIDASWYEKVDFKLTA